MFKEEFITRMISEDIGRGDLFSRVGEAKEIEAYIVAKSEGVFGGREYIEHLAAMYDVNLTWNIEDGCHFTIGERLISITGSSKLILSLERSILNIALHASSIASLTARYVAALEGSDVKLLDTRKTRPQLREFEKYAVRCGGGINHRMGLDDALMLKDTHLQTIDDLDLFMQEVRQKIPFTSKVEIECETLEMVKRAMHAGADIVMCDNMTLEAMEEVVAFRNSHYPHILLEASGNITLETVKAVASTGVDAISSGAMIHQANWIDLSMKVI